MSNALMKSVLKELLRARELDLSNYRRATLERLFKMGRGKDRQRPAHEPGKRQPVGTLAER